MLGNLWKNVKNTGAKIKDSAKATYNLVTNPIFLTVVALGCIALAFNAKLITTEMLNGMAAMAVTAAAPYYRIAIDAAKRGFQKVLNISPRVMAILTGTVTVGAGIILMIRDKQPSEQENLESLSNESRAEILQALNQAVNNHHQVRLQSIPAGAKHASPVPQQKISNIKTDDKQDKDVEQKVNQEEFKPPFQGFVPKKSPIRPEQKKSTHVTVSDESDEESIITYSPST